MALLERPTKSGGAASGSRFPYKRRAQRGVRGIDAPHRTLIQSRPLIGTHAGVASALAKNTQATRNEELYRRPQPCQLSGVFSPVKHYYYVLFNAISLWHRWQHSTATTSKL